MNQHDPVLYLLVDISGYYLTCIDDSPSDIQKVGDEHDYKT